MNGALSGIDHWKREAAGAALAEVHSGMIVGLGTGSTAKHFVDLLAEKVAAGLRCVGVPTSEATARQASALGIPLTTLDQAPELDLTVDGADEIGPRLALIKGAGGALLREKIVAASSRRMIVIADSSKLVDALGRFPLSIEVNPFGLAATSRQVRKIMDRFGAEGPLVQRMTPGGGPFMTDGGHFILDASFGRISNPEALATALSAVPGVVEHGLFLGLCHRAYIAGPTGIETLDV
ncbi:MAG TPA: ribose-5-phosphate isomerase RpiA [Devosia sp.]|nr:ribose-5-phosphate isomerase RpiA [Devosia sp.]